MSGRRWWGGAYLDAVVHGPVTSIGCDSPHILVTDAPRLTTLPLLRSARAVVFTEGLSLLAHETLLFMDYRIPFLFGVDATVRSLEGVDGTFYSSAGEGFISAGRLPLCTPRPHANREYCMASSVEGMEYCRQAGAREVAMRGEFIYLQSSETHPLGVLADDVQRSQLHERFSHVLAVAGSSFRRVLYRFSDFSEDALASLAPVGPDCLPSPPSLLGGRGSHLLLGDHRDLFAFELDLVVQQDEKTHNVTPLLPFVRTLDEAVQASRLVKRSFPGPLGCMVEVPALLGRASELDALFDFFVVGGSDLCQLLQGSDRRRFEFTADTVSFAAALLKHHFLPFISPSKRVYVVGETLYDRLSADGFSSRLTLVLLQATP